MEKTNCDLRWDLCGESEDGSMKTYRADLPEKDGTLFATVLGSVFGQKAISTVFVPNEVYVVDDTDYSQDPAAVAARAARVARRQPK
jgi:hypothetical protein